MRKQGAAHTLRFKFLVHNTTFWLPSPLFLHRFLLSGLAAKDSTFPPIPFNLAMEDMKKMKDMVDMWGGGEKGFRMALTLQKLHAARLKGKKELEWQKWVLEQPATGDHQW